MLKHRLYYSERLLCTELYVLFWESTDYTGRTESNVHSFQFILFVSSRLGMCDRLKSIQILKVRVMACKKRYVVYIFYPVPD